MNYIMQTSFCLQNSEFRNVNVTQMSNFTIQQDLEVNTAKISTFKKSDVFQILLRTCKRNHLGRSLTIIFMIHKSSLYDVWYQWAVCWMIYYYRHARILLIPLKRQKLQYFKV